MRGEAGKALGSELSRAVAEESPAGGTYVEDAHNHTVHLAARQFQSSPIGAKSWAASALTCRWETEARAGREKALGAAPLGCPSPWVQALCWAVGQSGGHSRLQPARPPTFPRASPVQAGEGCALCPRLTEKQLGGRALGCTTTPPNPRRERTRAGQVCGPVPRCGLQGSPLACFAPGLGGPHWPER